MIEVHELSRSFGDVVAVDGLSFAVPDGQLTGFVGANGAGKTTTMRMIMGLLTPGSGSVTMNGRPVTALDRRQFGYMPEERGLYPKAKVLSQLVYLGQLAGMSAGEAKTSALSNLEMLGLGDRAKDKLEKLSLGNQQRVQIVAAVLNRPSALILDEPFSGLDPIAVDTMTDLLREHAARGIPILFSSHQLDLVERICDRLVILSDGRSSAIGSVEELRAHGPARYRLVLDHDAGWLRDEPDLRVVDVDGRVAVLDLGDDPETAAPVIVRRALAHGGVLEFARIIPNLSEIYREVAA